MNKFIFCLLIIWLIPFHLVQAQLPANPIGSNPFHQKWNQINTNNFQLIFPQEVKNQAIRIASIIDYLHENHQTTIGDKSDKLPIILINQSVLSNGFVTVGPFRSEYILSPPQFDGTTDWIENLAIHEYRHVQQFSNATQGITGIVKSTLGSWAWGGMMATALPRWYFEGDAVVYETALSLSGRGRLPHFGMEYKALWEAQSSLGYEKAAAGSYKDFVPDWYQLGYYMISRGREKYGPQIWSTVRDDAVRYKGLFFPFNKALKRHAGIGTKDLFEDTMNELEGMWERTGKKNANNSRKVNSDHKETVIHYNAPLYLENGNILAYKNGYNQLPHIVQIDVNGREHSLTEPGFLTDREMTTLSYSNRKLTWAALSFDIRRRNKNFSDIFIYDLVAGKKNKLTKKGKYFSPSLSPDGTKIVTVKIDEGLFPVLEILDAKRGTVIKSFSNPNGNLYIHPIWNERGDGIFTIYKSNEQHSINFIDVESGQIESIIYPNYAQLSHLFHHNGMLYFSAGINGTNNIYRVNLESNKLFQVTNDLIGAFQPTVSFDGKNLMYSRFTSRGYDLYEQSLDSIEIKEIKLKSEIIEDLRSEMLAKQEGGVNLKDIINKDFEIKKYNKWSNILNPHSIIPDLTPPLAGLQILSDNSFSTLSASASAYYNYNENEWLGQAGISYAELFPVLQAGFAHAHRSALFLNFSPLNDTTIVQTNFSERWRENRLSGGFYIPLSRLKGNYLSRMQLGAYYRNISILSENRISDPNYSARDTIVVSPQNFQRFDELFTEIIDEDQIQSLDLIFNYRTQKLSAIQHLAPKWGINTSFRYRYSFGSKNIQGSSLLTQMDLFMPGLAKNHSFYINGMYQSENILDNYRFSDQFNYPRGYNFSLRRDRFYKIGVNYSFPVLYPDQAIGPLAFIKRVKANVFYDHGIMRIQQFPFAEVNDPMRSTGIEWTFDFRALRLLEIDLGFRYSYLFDDKFIGESSRHQFNFLLLRISE